MNVSITELTNNAWSIVITFGSYTVTAFSEGYPKQSEIQNMMDDIRNSVKRKEDKNVEVYRQGK